MAITYVRCGRTAGSRFGAWLWRTGRGTPEPPLLNGPLAWLAAWRVRSMEPRRKRRAMCIFAALTAIGALTFPLWQHLGPALKVTSASAVASPGMARCGTTVTATATVYTNGRSGTLRYRWYGGSGAVGAMHSISVGHVHTLQFAQTWTVQRSGIGRNEVTLEIESPSRTTVRVPFVSICR